MKIFVAHASAFGFQSKLYDPIRSSELGMKHTFFLPQENGRHTISREFIAQYDMVIAEVSIPSLGAGIELGWAHSLWIPVVCVYEDGVKISSAIHYVAQEVFCYSGSSDLLLKIEQCILRIGSRKG